MKNNKQIGGAVRQSSDFEKFKLHSSPETIAANHESA